MLQLYLLGGKSKVFNRCNESSQVMLWDCIETLHIKISSIVIWL